MPPRVVPYGSRTALPPPAHICSSRHQETGRFLQRRDYSQTQPRHFHESCRHATRLRRNMFNWLNGPGRVFREPLPQSTNYLGAYDRSGNLIRLRDSGRNEENGEEEDLDEVDKPKDEEAERQRIEEEEAGMDEVEREQRAAERAAEAAETQERRNGVLPKEKLSDLRPFPINQSFRSQAILSEELREEIWRQVAEGGQSISTVSAVFGVDMRRVAAVVRLKTVEKDWVSQEKRLATPYASAILNMLPQTKFDPKRKITPHESINDLPVHPLTRQQIFYPASESRQFTRADAAKVFSPTLLPADDRVPHPELIQLEKDIAAQIPREERVAAIRARDEATKKEKEDKAQRKQEWEARNITTVPGQRWNFKFQNVSVESVGKDGRGRGGIGWRYGMPHEDRKRGQVKIPTSVE